jgi:hypothetical protein
MSLDGDAPVAHEVESRELGKVVALSAGQRRAPSVYPADGRDRRKAAGQVSRPPHPWQTNSLNKLAAVQPDGYARFIMQDHELILGQRVFLQALRDLVKQREDLVRGARVSYKRNAAGDLVLAVIVPAVRLPRG